MRHGEPIHSGAIFNPPNKTNLPNKANLLFMPVMRVPYLKPMIWGDQILPGSEAVELIVVLLAPWPGTRISCERAPRSAISSRIPHAIVSFQAHGAINTGLNGNLPFFVAACGLHLG